MKQGFKIGWIYDILFRHPDGREQHYTMSNNVPTQGLVFLGDTFFKDGGTAPSWYIGILKSSFTGYTDAAQTLESAKTHNATQIRLPDNSVAFPQWACDLTGAPASYSNSASPAEVTFENSGTINIGGVYLSNNSDVVPSSGILMSTAALPAPIPVSNGSQMRIIATLNLTSA